jgi:histidyl-tRNA synthetase
MSITKVERVKGMNDILPDDYEVLKHIETLLRQCFESFGYASVDVPVLEYTDLHLRKSGEDIVARLYDFIYYNRRLCLRPEITASIARAYVENMQETALPIRFCYAGPVFRYEKPQRGSYRQFTQMGIELIGTTGAMADAEVIAAAYKGLEWLGLSDYRISIGHVGILAEFLKKLDLDERLQSFLLTKMDMLRKEGEPHVLERLYALYPAFRDAEASAPVPQAAAQGTTEEARAAENLADLLTTTDESTARRAILNFLRSTDIQLGSNREPDEIIERMMTKMRRTDQKGRIYQALSFMSKLGQLVGEPSRILEQIEQLLEAHGMSGDHLQQLRDLITTLSYYNLDPARIRIDLGLSRGLQYYTGMIFEVHHTALGENKQLCGGGRYDDLITVLGGRKEVPAAGFAYGIERIRLALESEQNGTQTRRKLPDAFVIAVSPDDYAYAVGVAEQLRQAGLRIELDIMGRSVKTNLQHANKQGVLSTIIVGAEERAQKSVILKDMASRDERRVSLEDIANQVNLIRRQYAETNR